MSKQKKPTIAICYDFDGTLSPRYMQEYGFFMGLDDSARRAFWKESNAEAKRVGADPILMYMLKMIEESKKPEAKVGTTRRAFKEYGKGIEYFNGVPLWFKRITAYAKSKGLNLEHYIISSGLKEMIEGSSIGRNFKQVYACSFVHRENDAAIWPAQVVNFTTKTQYLFRINKGTEDVSDGTSVNKYVKPEERPIPFSRMIYIGDGETDVPCMRLVKEQGGNSIIVYAPKKKNAYSKAKEYFNDGRVNYMIPADYSEGKLLDVVVKRIIDVVAARVALSDVAKKAIPKTRKKNDKDTNYADIDTPCEDVRPVAKTINASHTSSAESDVIDNHE